MILRSLCAPPLTMENTFTDPCMTRREAGHSSAATSLACKCMVQSCNMHNANTGSTSVARKAWLEFRHG